MKFKFILFLIPLFTIALSACTNGESSNSEEKTITIAESNSESSSEEKTITIADSDSNSDN